MFINDVHALGLQTAQGLVLTEAFYWDRNEAAERSPSDLRHIQKQHAVDDAGRRLCGRDSLSQGVEALKSDADGKAVVARMKAMPTDDPLFGKGSDPRRRPQDPRHVPVRGEEARRVEGHLGLLQAARYHSRRGGVPSAERRMAVH